MKITIGIDNNKTIVVLPYVTTEMLTISYGESPNENKDAVKYSQIKVMGAEPLAKVSISSVFPNGRQEYMEPDAYEDPMQYVRLFRNSRKNRKTMRVVITRNDGTEVFNRLCALETFEISGVNKNGDYSYSMEFEQYRLVY